ncbi:uncharacterized protein LOC112569214 [Pomacea canaliculata]|uniref:uncharacterized protein LOC112569214 n=1 Tax=Pomacea canaliculata TaxID=400727 RepID=UPI000D72EA78|nr:uncharacterized protein LOC112569214 [Pomacea canaliculata]
MEAESTMEKTACLVALLTLATLCSAQPKDKIRHEETIRVSDLLLRQMCQLNPNSHFCLNNTRVPTVDKRDFSQDVQGVSTYKRLRHRGAAFAGDTDTGPDVV